MSTVITKENFIANVFDKYHVEIFNFILSRTGYRKELAEDITQEVFFRLWKSRDKYNPKKASLRTWTYIITRNYLIDYFRGNKENRNNINLKPDDEFASDVTIESAVDNAELFRAVTQSIGLLKPAERELIQLRYIQELKIKEIAKILNKNGDTIKVAIHRAIKKLRRLLSNE